MSLTVWENSSPPGMLLMSLPIKPIERSPIAPTQAHPPTWQLRMQHVKGQSCSVPVILTLITYSSFSLDVRGSSKLSILPKAATSLNERKVAVAKVALASSVTLSTMGGNIGLNSWYTLVEQQMTVQQKPVNIVVIDRLAPSSAIEWACFTVSKARAAMEVPLYVSLVFESFELESRFGANPGAIRYIFFQGSTQWLCPELQQHARATRGCSPDGCFAQRLYSRS